MIRRRKDLMPISANLHAYLQRYRRIAGVPAIYDELTRFIGSAPYEDDQGNETLWLTVFYTPEDMQFLREQLAKIYLLLKIGEANTTDLDHLEVDRIDFGEFGNSSPFRVCVINRFNDNRDYFYVKKADANRIYGLELEHLLSPYRINYFVKGNMLIEDHIAGVPGNVFIKHYLPDPRTNLVRVAKEFVKFNERCFCRLLGDMRSVNYILEVMPDFEEISYRARPIDFDQQSYEGNIEVYHSYRFEDNNPVNEMVRGVLNTETIRQYQREERTQMSRRARSEIRRLNNLLKALRNDPIAPIEHIKELGTALNKFHHTNHFIKYDTMGELTSAHLRALLR